MGSKCKILFSGPPKGTSLRETALFDVLIMKIGAGVLAVGCRKNQKQDAQLSQRDRAAGCVIVFAKSRRLELGDNILQTL